MTQSLILRLVVGFIITGLCLMLNACFVNKYAIQPIDAPLILNNHELIRGCRVLKKLTLIEPECWMAIYSESRYNDSGLVINETESYEIEVPPNQFLFDKTRYVLMPQGDKGGSVTKYFNFTKRNKNADWFALMAIVVNPEQAVLNKDDESAIDISKVATIYQKKGRLIFYVNDTGSNFFYENNQGRIWIKIKLKESE